MKLLIATKNPGKIEGAKEAFSNYFKNIEIEGIPVPSGVGEEPVNEDIYKGATNRINNLISKAKDEKINADYYLSIESGITNSLGKWVILSIALIEDKNGYRSFGVSPAFPVPDKLVGEIIEKDLGHVMDDIFEGKKLSEGKGGISFLTKDVVTRIDLTKLAFTMALTEQINLKWKDIKEE